MNQLLFFSGFGAMKTLVYLSVVLTICLYGGGFVQADLVFSHVGSVDSDGGLFTGNNTSASSLHTTLTFSGDLTEINTSTFASEARFRVNGTHEYQVTSVTGFTGTLPVSNVLNGLFWAPEVQGTVAVETFETVDDGNDGVSDATWSNVSFELDGAPTVVDIGSSDIGSSFRVDTEGSTVIDTVLAAYRANGTLIVSDDDAGTGNLSSIDLDLESLGLGTYYLVTGSFNMGFSDYRVTANGTGTGDIHVNVNDGLLHSESLESGEIIVLQFTVVPEPAHTIVVVGLLMLAVGRRRRSGHGLGRFALGLR